MIVIIGDAVFHEPVLNLTRACGQSCGRLPQTLPSHSWCLIFILKLWHCLFYYLYIFNVYTTM